MKKVINLLLFILCGGLFMMCALGSGSEVDSSDYDTTKVYSVGETLNCPYFDVIVKDVKIKKKGTYIDSYQYISDPEWLGVIINVKNKSDKTRTFYSSGVKLINSSGEVINNSYVTYKIWGTELLESPEMISGGSKTGYVQFANSNTDNKNLTLQIDCSTDTFDDDVIYKVNISK